MDLLHVLQDFSLGVFQQVSLALGVRKDGEHKNQEAGVTKNEGEGREVERTKYEQPARG